MPRVTFRPSSEQEWLARVRRLEDEITGLKRAMQTRGLIEQAKGVLAERLSCDPETAFQLLAHESQRQNLPVVQVAADLVGATVPDASDAEDPPAAIAGGAVNSDTARPPDLALRTVTGLADTCAELPTPLSRRLRQAVAALDAAANLHDVVTVLAGCIGGGHGAAAVFSREPDGAIRLLAWHGIAPQTASEWRRYPASVRTPVTTAVATGRPVLIDGVDPHDLVMVGAGPRRIVWPLTTDDGPVGALALVWPDAGRFSPCSLTYLERLATAAGRVIRSRWSAGAAASPAWDDPMLQPLLHTLYGRWHVLAPLRRDGGTVDDFEIRAASTATADDGDTVGRRLLDVYPQLRADGVFDAYVALLDGAPSYEHRARPEDAVVAGRPRRVLTDRRATRLGDLVVAAWERVDEPLRMHRRMDRVEALTRCGWIEWDLIADDVTWSPGLTTLLGRVPSRSAMSPARFPDVFTGPDRPRLRHLIEQITEGERPVAHLSLARTPPVRVRVFGEADRAADQVSVVRLVLQDVGGHPAR